MNPIINHINKNQGEIKNMKLKLITTETFGNVPCDFYRNMNDEMLLTREQIGQALKYKDPMNAIYKIHKRHEDRLDELSICLPDGLGHSIYYYNERGVMEICRWSNSKKANQFMDWVWDIIESYRNNTIQQQIDIQPLVTAITNLTQGMIAMQQDIKELKKSSDVHTKAPSSFYMRMKDKYQLLQEYYNCTRAKLYSEMYKELEDTYDIDLNQIYEDYCYENRINRSDCYIMDAIEHTPQLRDALELLVNTTLVQNNLMTEEQTKKTKRKTIFSKETNRE